jgi:hypothetical protein
MAKKSDMLKNLTCNKPKRDVQGGKEMVVRACSGGKEKIVRFGDANMELGVDNAKRKKSYCARSAGIKGGDGKLSANYWRCYPWYRQPQKAKNSCQRERKEIRSARDLCELR